MLEQKGFRHNMIKWLMCCVSTPTISILINGVPTEPFRIHRGLRQGDPIFPFLFNMVLESLSFVIGEAVSKDLIAGVQVGENNVTITHLQYA